MCMCITKIDMACFNMTDFKLTKSKSMQFLSPDKLSIFLKNQISPPKVFLKLLKIESFYIYIPLRKSIWGKIFEYILILLIHKRKVNLGKLKFISMSPVFFSGLVNIKVILKKWFLGRKEKWHNTLRWLLVEEIISVCIFSNDRYI